MNARDWSKQVPLRCKREKRGKKKMEYNFFPFLLELFGAKWSKECVFVGMKASITTAWVMVEIEGEIVEGRGWAFGRRIRMRIRWNADAALGHLHCLPSNTLMQYQCHAQGKPISTNAVHANIPPLVGDVLYTRCEAEFHAPFQVEKDTELTLWTCPPEFPFKFIRMEG